MQNDSKILKFENLSVKSFDLAKKRREDNDLDGALSVLFSIEDKGNCSCEVYSEIAEIYYLMNLYVNSVDYWFKYYHNCLRSRTARACNGIGACFYKLGQVLLAAYYFEEQLANSDDEDEFLYTEELYDFYQNSMDLEEPKIKLCYSESGFSGKYYIDSGDDKMSALLMQEAILEYQKVSKNDTAYVEAQIKIADAYEKLKDIPKALEVLTILFNENSTNSKVFSELLFALAFIKDKPNVEDYNEYFKIAENVMQNPNLAPKDYDENYYYLTFFAVYNYSENLFLCLKYLLNVEPYNHRLLLYKGIYFHNSKRYAEAIECYKMANRIVPSYLFSTYISLSEEALEKEIKKRKKKIIDEELPLEYVYNYQKFDDERFDIMTTMLCENPNKSLKSFSIEEVKIIIDWTIRYNQIYQTDLAYRIMEFCSTEIRDYYIQSLLDVKVFDLTKIHIILMLAQTGYDKRIGAVIGGIYIKIPMYRMEFGTEKNSIFMKAYSLAFAKTVTINVKKAGKIRDAAYKLYYALRENDKIRRLKANSIVSLACAITIAAKCSFDFSEDELIDNFGADKTEVNKILVDAKEIK